MSSSIMTILQAVERLLGEARQPLHYRDITAQILEKGYWKTSGKTPQDTVRAVIVRDDIESKGQQSIFKKTAPGTFALRKWQAYPEYGVNPIGDEFRLLEINIKNFKGIASKSLNFSENFNVLIGDNGSGKTAILDAVAVALGGFIREIDREGVPEITIDQVRRARIEQGQTITSEPQYPVIIDCSVNTSEATLSWERRKGDQTQKTTRTFGGSDLNTLIKQLKGLVQTGSAVTLPVIAYYSTGRLWRTPNIAPIGNQKPSRWSGYKNCLDPSSHTASLIEWMRDREMEALQESEIIYVLEAVKAAIVNCLKTFGIINVAYRIRERDLIAENEVGPDLPISMLSDGFRNMLAMVADIAHRAAILNPHLEKEVAYKTPGIVLVDEIDLHLHPNWQRQVVEDLRSTFPKMQFICTTHSPFIVQSLRSGELFDLNQHDLEPTSDYVNKSIEDIAEQVMEVPLPQRSERYQQMFDTAKRYYALLEAGENTSNPNEIKDIKEQLDTLIAPYSDDVAYHAYLEFMRETSTFNGSSNATSGEGSVANGRKR